MDRTRLSIAWLTLTLTAAAPFGCGSEVNTNQQAAGSASSSSGGGGSGGSGGGGGSGGAGGAEPGGTYSAHNLFTHVPRFVIFKADPVRDLCFRLTVEGLGSGGIGIETTDPWAVAQAEVTEHASDCVLENGYPKPAPSAVPAMSGTGTLTIEGSFPCSATIHAKITFDPPAGWVPAVESLDAEALPIDGGCG